MASLDRGCNSTPPPIGTTASAVLPFLAPADIFLDHSANYSRSISSAQLAQCFSCQSVLGFPQHGSLYRSWLRLPSATLS